MTAGFVQCTGCRRLIPASAAMRAMRDASHPERGTCWQCRDCRGAFLVVREDVDGFTLVGGAAATAFDGLIAWWEAMEERDERVLHLVWQPAADGNMSFADRHVFVASSTVERDGITPEGRPILVKALGPAELRWPIWWHPREPLTWWLWDAVTTVVAVSERRGPAVTVRDVTTAVTDYGDHRDPAVFGGLPDRVNPQDAAAWWFDMLAPVHRARVAMLETNPDRLARIALAPGDFSLLTAPPPALSGPGFAAELGQRRQAAVRFLEALEKVRS